MMTRLLAFTFAALTLPALAQSPVPAQLIHIPGASVQPIPLAEWEVPVRDVAGPQVARIRIAEGRAAVARAPDEATRYTAKEYVFPMGMLRVLTFDKDAGPVVHQITYETELFLLQGSGTVGSGGKDVAIKAGDAVFLPSGVLRNPNPAEDTVVALFTVAHTADNPKSMVVRGAELDTMTIAQYVRDGESQTVVQQDVAKAPPGAGIFDLKRYSFDGNSIRLAMLRKGGSTTPATNGGDILIYIIKGRMLRHEDGKTYEVVAGDAIREEAGKTGYWDLLEESEFIATNMPLDPSIDRAYPLRDESAEVGVDYE